MHDEIKKFLVAVAKRHNLTTAPQLIDPEQGLLVRAVQAIEEAPLSVFVEAAKEITQSSKIVNAPMYKQEAKGK